MGTRKNSLASGAQRARELAAIARTLEERKRQLAYGEFERWAVRTFPKYPIQVLRYLRKCQRVFGTKLTSLFERFGQKKVFLLVGLQDPWGPIKSGIAVDGQRARIPVEQLSVSQLREAIRQRNGNGMGRSPTGWGGLNSTLGRVATMWPKLQKVPLGISLSRDGTRRQLHRFRELLRDAVRLLDLVLSGDGAQGDGEAPRPTRKPSRLPRPKSPPRDATFLD